MHRCRHPSGLTTDRTPAQRDIVFVLLGPLREGPEALFVAIVGAIVVLLAVMPSVHPYRVWKSDPGKCQP